MLGQVAFDHVVRKLDLLERDYFGLMYEDDHKKMVNDLYTFCPSQCEWNVLLIWLDMITTLH